MILFSAFSALVFALLAPAVLSPRFALANFGDLYAYHYPLRHLAFSALQAGRLPFWDPYIFAGLPLAANPQSALFYPVSVLGALFPLTLAFSWDTLFHLLWGALGLLLVARYQLLSSAASLLLAALFVLSPFLTYRIAEGIPTILACLSWVPWVWLAWLSGAPGLLAGAFALQFFSGHPQFLMINVAAMVVWAVIQNGNGLRRKALFSLFQGGLAALFLTCVQWMPTWEFVSRSVRRGWPEAFMTAYSLDLGALWTWLYPDAWGNPWDKTFAGPPSVFFESSGVYVGVLGMALAAAGLLKARSKASWLLMGLGVFLAAGAHNPLYHQILGWTPLGLLRTPARCLFLSFWGLLLAAGAGARWFDKRRLPRWLRLAALIAALIELLAWDRRFLRAEDARPYLKPSPALAGRIGGAPWRVLTDPELASPNKTLLYRAMNANGYEAFYLADFPEYAARSEGRAAVDASRSYLRRYDSPEMSRLGVRYFLSADGSLLTNAGAFPLAYFVDEKRKPLGPPPGLSIERPERWRVSGILPADARRLVLAQPFYPGWRAVLNGLSLPLEKWDGLLQAVNLPEGFRAGEGFELVLDFSPTGWPLWASFSLLSWLVWAIRLRLPRPA